MSSIILHYIQPGGRARYAWPVWALLSVLLVGPLLGPVFAWLDGPLLAVVNVPIYWVGAHLCPQPDLAFPVLGHPMVVCARCWAGVGGLWIVLLIYRAAPRHPFWTTWRRLPPPARAVLGLLAFGPWIIDLTATAQSWWASGPAFLLLSGLLGGLGAGALLFPATSTQ